MCFVWIRIKKKTKNKSNKLNKIKKNYRGQMSKSTKTMPLAGNLFERLTNQFFAVAKFDFNHNF